MISNVVNRIGCALGRCADDFKLILMVKREALFKPNLNQKRGDLGLMIDLLLPLKALPLCD